MVMGPGHLKREKAGSVRLSSWWPVDLIATQRGWVVDLLLCQTNGCVLIVFSVFCSISEYPFTWMGTNFLHWLLVDQLVFPLIEVSTQDRKLCITVQRECIDAKVFCSVFWLITLLTEKIFKFISFKYNFHCISRKHWYKWHHNHIFRLMQKSPKFFYQSVWELRCQTNKY